MYYMYCNTHRHFKVVDTSDVKDAAKLFFVPDFVSDAVKLLPHV